MPTNQEIISEFREKFSHTNFLGRRELSYFMVDDRKPEEVDVTETSGERLLNKLTDWLSSALDRVRSEGVKEYLETIKKVDNLTWVEALNQARQEERERIKGIIENMKKDTSVVNCGGSGIACPVCATCGQQEKCECDIYNQAISDILNQL